MEMQVDTNISLKGLNTFGLDYKADFIVHIKTEEDAVSFLKNDHTPMKPLLIIGRGSNILFTGDFKGTILLAEMNEFCIEEEHNEEVIVSAGAGVKWDDFVEWTVNKGYGGLENLSLIPGLVGATPVQNIGAYGVEVGELIEKVRAVSIDDGSVKEFSNNDLGFGYRHSTFKSDNKGKYLIIKVYYRLSTRPEIKLDYGSLNDEIMKTGEVTLKNVREAVIKIRKSKLPDPEIIGNAGSFFKNPVVPAAFWESMKKSYPDVPAYTDIAGMKLAAGWLIEQCGWKGKRIGDAGVHQKQSLVIVNYGKASGKEIYNLSESIKKSVLEKFGIELEREVEIIGSI
jgi:UDP-N-acetylmuramate dehydrogenase